MKLFFTFLLVFSFQYDDAVHIPYMTDEMKAIATCESGDTITFGTVDWTAVNVNKDGTIDSGAFQFNSYWVWNSSNTWIMRHVINDLGMDARSFFKEFPTARHAPPSIQIMTFEYLWDNGRGWKNWNASKYCWGEWMYIDNNGVARIR